MSRLMLLSAALMRAGVAGCAVRPAGPRAERIDLVVLSTADVHGRVRGSEGGPPAFVRDGGAFPAAT